MLVCTSGELARLSMEETCLPVSVERCMECIHIYLDAQYVGTMACPQCRIRRAVNVPEQCPQILPVVGKQSVTTTCRCGAIFAAYFDLRRHLRKAVQLRGMLGDPQTGTPLSDTVISSLSVHGLGFTLATVLSLHIGERCTTSFCLDDAEQSLIQEGIIIRRLQGLTVGATFYPDEKYNYALDFYVYKGQLLPPPPPHSASGRPWRWRTPLPFHMTV